MTRNVSPLHPRGPIRHRSGRHRSANPRRRDRERGRADPAFLFALLVLPLAALGACSGGGDGTGPAATPPSDSDRNLNEICELDMSFVADGGVGRDGIPALTDPSMTTASSSSGLDFLAPDSRVIAFEVDGRSYAVPHNILWFHEIVNLNLGVEALAVTYCPLTGTSLVFDRSAAADQEFGVSGLLFKNNLMMFDRGGEESLWPQMLAGARCGGDTGTELPQWPAGEMTWAAFRSRHPEGRVVSSNTGHPFDYRPQNYPYGDYESLGNDRFLFPMPALDRRRPPKERVVGVRPTDTERGIAFPFRALEEQPGGAAVVEFDHGGAPAVLLWSDGARGGRAFRPRTRSGRSVALEAGSAGIVDVDTGSRWTVEGRAVSGPREGEKLVPIRRSYVAFWAAWAAFFPDTRLWSEG